MRLMIVILLGVALPLVAFGQVELLPTKVSPDSPVAALLATKPAIAAIVGLVLHFLAGILNTQMSDRSWFGTVVRISSLAVGPRGRNDPNNQ